MIPFNRASVTPLEESYVLQALSSGRISGDGPNTKRAQSILEEMHGPSTALLTTSCTSALEMSARLLDLQPGDEVIVPSYTFVSTASAFVWNGAKPVFADISLDTMNIDPASVESLITERTRAVSLVHYAGVGAQPDLFAEMTASHGLSLIEDNAHGLGGRWKGQALGTFGSLSTLSFHETKNVSCGEGGALIVRDPALVEAAEIIREKGTDRSRFLRGQVDKYTWVDVGSSWVMSDVLAAMLVAQLERFDDIQLKRKSIFERYAQGLADWSGQTGVVLPFLPAEADHPAHMFYVRLGSLAERDDFIAHMKSRGILSVFHYQPLHLSPAAVHGGYRAAECPNTIVAAETLVRLPLFVDLTDVEVSKVIEAVTAWHM